MNSYASTLFSAFDEFFTELKRALEGINDEEAYTQPSPGSNPIGWLVWHMARVEDHWINGMFCGNEHQWTRGGWDKKFGMPSEGNGARLSIEQVMAMPRIGLTDLIAYYDAVRAETSQVIRSLTDEQLAKSIEHPRKGPITGSWIIGHVIVEESQHAGQVAMIRGILHGFDK